MERTSLIFIFHKSQKIKTVPIIFFIKEMHILMTAPVNFIPQRI
jgi:hypothetical protein